MILERIARFVERVALFSWSEAGHILKRAEVRDRSVHLLVDSTAFLDPHEAAGDAAAHLQERMEIGDLIVAESTHAIRLI